MSFSEESLYAFATWWADHLPGAGDIPDQEIRNIDSDLMLMATNFKAQARQEDGLVVTADQYYDFIEALVENLKYSDQKRTKYGGTYLELVTDYNPDETLSDALEKAGISSDVNSLPWKTRAYLHDDGRIFVPGKKGRMEVLEYQGSPDVPYADLESVDFSGCFYYRRESMYLMADLEPGQKVKTALRYRWGTEYKEREAQEGQVLVVPKYAAPLFDELTQDDLLDIEKWPSVTAAYLEQKERYVDGAEDFGVFKEVVDDKGHVRGLTAPFRLKPVKEQMAYGHGYDYCVAEPGDFISEKTDHERTSVLKKESVDDGGYSYLPCDENGNFQDQPEAASPVTPGQVPAP